MTFLTELDQWEAGVYQLETTDPVVGGPDGIDNLQAKQLANRTKWLKGQLEALGEGVQPLDDMLTALAALVTTADKALYFTGANAPALATFTAYARTLVAAADAAAARGVLSVPSVAEMNTAIAALVNSAPAALDTLNELAAALGNDANFATTVTNALALKAVPTVAQNWTAGQRSAPAALPATTGVVTLDLAARNNWAGTLTGGITLANPSSMPVGQSGVITLTQGATPYTIAYGSYWKPTNGAALDSLTATAGAVDDLVYFVESATRVLVGRAGGAS